MYNLTLTDNFGLLLDVSPGIGTALMKYLRNPGDIAAALRNPKPIQNAAIGDDPFGSQSVGLSFTQPVNLGAAGVELTLSPQLLGTVTITKGEWLFDPESDPCGESVPNPDPAHQAFVSVGLNAQLSSTVAAAPGSLQFSFTAGSGVTLTNYRAFPLASPITEALRTLVQNFVIPRELNDVELMAPGSVATVEGSGTVTFSATANLLSSVNPLASLGAGAAQGLLNIQEGAAVKVGAAVTLTGAYQLRVHRLDGRKFRLSYEKKRSTEFGVNVAAQIGVTATAGQFEIIHTVLQAVSGDPVPDQDTFRQAGLSDEQIGAIAAALQCGIERSIQLAIAGELDALDESSTGFSYEIDLDALDDAGRKAASDALAGVLTGLEGPPLGGVRPLQSAFTSLRQGNKILKVNLLGIFNHASVSDLFQAGTMIVDRESGDITVTDKAGADRIGFGADNFAPDAAKLRKVLAESFLLTAAYRSSATVRQTPQLSSNYWFFELQQKTHLKNLLHYLNIAQSLRVISPPVASAKLAAAAAAGALGRSTFYAEGRYNDALATRMFLDSGGRPRPQSEYENLGRTAMLLLLPPGDTINDARRLPLTDNATWHAMTVNGQPNGFGGLFDESVVGANQLGDITSDYTLIEWWAGAMSSMGVALAALTAYVARNPKWDPQDSTFKKLRSDLDSAMAKVAANTQNQFAEPWGLLAMDLAAGQKADTTVRIRCPQLNLDGVRHES
ncbi:MAG TPA: hypothetical protein VL523_08445 [Terriglobia bacterium]|nr:hypothetical protein [Terriglobia bacterium]